MPEMGVYPSNERGADSGTLQLPHSQNPNTETVITQELSPPGGRQDEALAVASQEIPVLADGRFPISLPWPRGGIGTFQDIATVSFTLAQCSAPRRPRFDYPFSRDTTGQRGVTAVAPPTVDLMDARIANSVLVAGVQFAYQRCPIWGRDGAIYGGVSVNVVQNSLVAIRTGETTKPDESGTIYFSSFEHPLYKQTAENERDQAAAKSEAESEKWWSNFWSTFKLIFYLAFGAGVIAVLYRYGPPILTRIMWFFFPHPAISQITRSTRGRQSAPVDGNALADAFGFVPANDTEAELARRDIETMNQRIKTEKEILNAHEELERKVIEMEQARARVEELERMKKAV